MQALTNTLGYGDALKTKLNKNLEAKGIKASTGVSDPVVSSASPPRNNSDVYVGGIIGGCLGGVAIVIGILVYCRYYVKKKKPDSAVPEATTVGMLGV